MIFAVRHVHDKCRDQYAVFIDLKNVFDTVNSVALRTFVQKRGSPNFYLFLFMSIFMAAYLARNVKLFAAFFLLIRLSNLFSFLCFILFKPFIQSLQIHHISLFPSFAILPYFFYSSVFSFFFLCVYLSLSSPFSYFLLFLMFLFISSIHFSFYFLFSLMSFLSTFFIFFPLSFRHFNSLSLFI
ncbi:unnamed protein product [Acanthosepion pharaonis]|uniref:Reverse transcriptase domain-containing protein n=1 Tax=Acanthosepion pharaonis TaxID=158019 RepID=A0A812DR04_ACAPH|nr:unnamed protein product [Sepia pharaonis]